MGGTDHKSNLVKLSIEEHAEAHRKLYEEHGKQCDYNSWKGLSALASNAKPYSYYSPYSKPKRDPKKVYIPG
jgi:hypothetical protein